MQNVRSTVLQVTGALKFDKKMDNRSKHHCSHKCDVPLRQMQSSFPRYSRVCCTHYRGNNPLPRQYREFQSHSRGNTEVLPQIPLPCHSLISMSLAADPYHELSLQQVQPTQSVLLLSSGRKISKIPNVDDRGDGMSACCTVAPGDEREDSLT